MGQVLEEVARLGFALLFQTAFEAEVTEFLGRDRYARGERVREGLRNGYSPITVKTTAGPVTVERPKLRGTLEPFVSRLLGITVTRTKALESLVIASFVRGLSVRDVEATLAEALGEHAALSKSTVSQICQALVSQFEVWMRRDLSDYELDHLFGDASFFKYHPRAAGEPLLCSWGITTEGKKAFIGLAAGGYGVLLAALGIGAIAGGLLVPRINARLSVNQLVATASLVLAAAMVVVVAIPSI